MAPKSNIDPFTQAVINLRSHLIKCYVCRAAFAANADRPGCIEGMTMAMSVAKTCDKLLDLKRKAVSTINGYVYACPDVASHGNAYALTAQPLSVVATQDELF